MVAPKRLPQGTVAKESEAAGRKTNNRSATARGGTPSSSLKQPLLAPTAGSPTQPHTAAAGEPPKREKIAPRQLISAHVMMLTSQALFAGNYVFFRAFSTYRSGVFGETSASVFSLMRGLVSLLLLPIIYWASPDRHVSGCLSLRKENVKPVLIQGLAGAARQNLVPFGLMFTEATSAGIVQPFVPVGTCMLSILLGLEKGSFYKYLSMVFGGIGVFIASKGYAFQGVDLGFLILLGVPVTKAAQVTGQKIALSTMRPMAVQFYQIICLAVFTTPFALAVMKFLGYGLVDTWLLVCKLDWLGWGAILYSVVFIILVSWRIQLAAVKLLGPIAVGLYQVTQPIFCFIMAHLILGEPYYVHQILGGSLVCLGLGIYAYGQLRAAQTREKKRAEASQRAEELAQQRRMEAGGADRVPDGPLTRMQGEHSTAVAEGLRSLNSYKSGGGRFRVHMFSRGQNDEGPEQRRNRNYGPRSIALRPRGAQGTGPPNAPLGNSDAASGPAFIRPPVQGVRTVPYTAKPPQKAFSSEKNPAGPIQQPQTSPAPAASVSSAPPPPADMESFIQKLTSPQGVLCRGFMMRAPTAGKDGLVNLKTIEVVKRIRVALSMNRGIAPPMTRRGHGGFLFVVRHDSTDSFLRDPETRAFLEWLDSGDNGGNREACTVEARVRWNASSQSWQIVSVSYLQTKPLVLRDLFLRYFKCTNKTTSNLPKQLRVEAVQPPRLPSALGQSVGARAPLPPQAPLHSGCESKQLWPLPNEAEYPEAGVSSSRRQSAEQPSSKSPPRPTQRIPNKGPPHAPEQPAMDTLKEPSNVPAADSRRLRSRLVYTSDRQDTVTSMATAKAPSPASHRPRGASDVDSRAAALKEGKPSPRASRKDEGAQSASPSGSRSSARSRSPSESSHGSVPSSRGAASDVTPINSTRPLKDQARKRSRSSQEESASARLELHRASERLDYIMEELSFRQATIPSLENMSTLTYEFRFHPVCRLFSVVTDDMLRAKSRQRIKARHSRDRLPSSETGLAQSSKAHTVTVPVFFMSRLQELDSVRSIMVSTLLKNDGEVGVALTRQEYASAIGMAIPHESPEAAMRCGERAMTEEAASSNHRFHLSLAAAAPLCPAAVFVIELQFNPAGEVNNLPLGTMVASVLRDLCGKLSSARGVSKRLVFMDSPGQTDAESRILNSLFDNGALLRHHGKALVGGYLDEALADSTSTFTRHLQQQLRAKTWVSCLRSGKLPKPGISIDSGERLSLVRSALEDLEKTVLHAGVRDATDLSQALAAAGFAMGKAAFMESLIASVLNLRRSAIKGAPKFSMSLSGAPGVPQVQEVEGQTDQQSPRNYDTVTPAAVVSNAASDSVLSSDSEEMEHDVTQGHSSGLHKSLELQRQALVRQSATAMIGRFSDSPPNRVAYVRAELLDCFVKKYGFAPDSPLLSFVFGASS